MDTTPIPASYASSSSFTVAAGYISQFAAGMRVLADCGTDGEQYGTVASVSGTTVVLTMDAGNALTANLTGVLHSNDIPASLANHGHTGQADGGLLGTATPTANAHPIASALGRLTAWIDAATTSVAGIVKLATTAMCQAGTDTTTAVTPAGLVAWLLAIIGINPSQIPTWSLLGTAAALDISLLGPRPVTWDAPSCAAGAQVSTTASIPGAEMGDRVYATCGTALSGLMLRGEVTAQDTVTIYLYNPTGSAVDLASATYYVTVWQLTPRR